MQVRDVEIKKVETDMGLELSDTIYRTCAFCDKIVRVSSLNFQSCLRLGGKKFFCPFCLRNNCHLKSNRNILVMSYRGIVGYYYHRMYRFLPPKMWAGEIEQYIERHVHIGLQNPVMSYDSDTYLWFVNFNQVEGSRGAPFDEVVQASKEMLLAFELKSRIDQSVEVDVWCKFQKALDIFHLRRKRPKNRRMLIPTLSGTIVPAESEDFFNKTREFTKSCLVVR